MRDILLNRSGFAGEAPRRRFWQMHLSTLVVLTLLSGVLVLMNVGVKTSVNITRSKAWPDSGDFVAKV
jgi:hypothetical protein